MKEGELNDTTTAPTTDENRRAVFAALVAAQDEGMWVGP